MRQGASAWFGALLGSVLILVLALSERGGSQSAAAQGAGPSSAQTCVRCHSSVVDAEFVHGSANDTSCLGCHQKVAAPVPVCESGFGFKLPAEGNQLCMSCHKEGSQGAPAGTPQFDLQKGTAHESVAEGECLDCHKLHSASFPKLLVSSRPALCFLCHEKKEFLSDAVHKPVSEGQCNVCHDPHVSENDYLLRKENVNDVCLLCHQSGATIEGASTKQFDLESGEAHESVAEGECTNCHAPHHSKHEKLLVGSRPALCFLCHGKEEFLSERTGHPPVKAGQCNVCHDPHVSENDTLLRKESINDVCLTCHAPDAQGKGLPRWRIDLHKKTVHPALEGTGDCTNCHAPHQSENDRLLHDSPPELCFSCHKKAKFEGPSVHSAVVLGRCTVCHNPHATDPPHLQRAEGSDLCFRCHADDVTGRHSLHKPVADGQCLACHAPHVAENKKNLVRGDPTQTCLSCHGPEGDNPRKVDLGKPVVHGAVTQFGCTGCHDPHGSDADRLLLKDVNDLCITCHADQASGYHIFQTFDGRPHPVAAPKDPLRPGRPFGCTSCHNPHASDHPRLWYWGEKKTDICANCHK